MNKTKYNQLREEIILVVPEIVGCGDPNCKDGHYPYQAGEDGSDVEWGGCPTCVKNGNYDPPVRDITLEDCLIAIKKEIEKDNIGHSDGYGYIMDLCYREQPNSWKLNIPLQDQSDETLTMLADLLL